MSMPDWIPSPDGADDDHNWPYQFGDDPDEGDE